MCMYIYIYLYAHAPPEPTLTHTHTHIYIYIHIYMHAYLEAECIYPILAHVLSPCVVLVYPTDTEALDDVFDPTGSSREDVVDYFPYMC